MAEDAARTEVDRTAASHTASDVLGGAAVTRLRRLNVALIGVYPLVTAVLLVWGERSQELWILVAGMAIGVPCSAGALVYLRQPSEMLRNSAWVAAAFMVPAMAVCFASLTYFGFFSMVHALLAVSLFAATVNVPRSVSRVVYAGLAVVAAVGMYALALGFFPDRGRMRPVGDRAELLVLATLAQLLYFGVYRLAVTTGDLAQSAVDDLERALRDVAQRDAVLGEVRDDLARVMQGRGRASGLVVGSWRLGGLLGRGGMGEVYDATSTTGDSVAAVKVMSADDVDDDLRQRFRREAEAMRRLDHPNVVKLLEVGDHYIAMERLRGSDLASILRERPQLAIAEVVELVSQVAGALEAARAADVVHRDLKPHNLFFTPETRTWKVLDFGISKMGSSTTLTQGVVGTPAYMAPEHIDGTPVTHLTDLFSLALVAYRAATGRPAFSGNDPKVLAEVLDAMPARPSEIATLDEDVDLVIALAIAKAPKDRIATAGAFAEAFASAARGELAAGLRERARGLVRKHPWGARK